MVENIQILSESFVPLWQHPMVDKLLKTEIMAQKRLRLLSEQRRGGKLERTPDDGDDMISKTIELTKIRGPQSEDESFATNESPVPSKRGQEVLGMPGPANSGTDEADLIMEPKKARLSQQPFQQKSQAANSCS
jgi:hypothetical protein